MNIYIESKLGMYDSVRAIANDNATAVATLAALQAAYAEFEDIFNEIRSLSEAEGRPTQPSTAQKRQARKKLEREIFKLAGLLKAYAVENQMEALISASKVNGSDFYRITDEELPALSLRIKTRLLENLAGLLDYGVDAARVAAFEDLINDYEAKVMAPKAAISNRRSAKAVLSEKVKACDILLKSRIDSLMEEMREDYPGFYFSYFAARKIYKNPSRQTTLRIEVRDNVGNPVSKAQVSIAELESSLLTDNQGICEFKPIPNGTYDLSAAKDGYKTAYLSEAQTRLGKRITFVIFIELAA